MEKRGQLLVLLTFCCIATAIVATKMSNFTAKAKSSFESQTNNDAISPKNTEIIMISLKEDYKSSNARKKRIKGINKQIKYKRKICFIPQTEYVRT